MFIRKNHRMSIAAAVLTALAALPTLAAEIELTEDTEMGTLNVTEDTTISGNYNLFVTNLTGSSGATLTLTGKSTLLPYNLPSWNTSLPAFQIDSGSTLSLYLDYIHSAYEKGTLYFHAPVHGDGTLYLRTYQKDEHVYVSPTNSTFNGTISIYHRANQRNRNGIRFGCDGGPDGDYFPNRPLMTCAGNYSGNVYLGRYIVDHPLTVRGLSGAQSLIYAQDGSYSGTRFIDVELADDYSFSGQFLDSGSETCHSGLIVGSKAGTAYTQTLGGENTTYGALIVTNGATVAFSGSGSWTNGPVFVANDAGLTLLAAAKNFSSLSMASGSLLTLANAAETGATVGNMIIPEDGFVRLVISDTNAIASAMTDGAKLIAWTVKPAGSFVFDSVELAKNYKLVVGDDGLTVASDDSYVEPTEIGTWTGNGGNAWFDNRFNWSDNVLPAETNKVVFPALAAGADSRNVVLGSAKTVAAVQVEGDTKFSGARLQVTNLVVDGVSTSGVTGSGKIILGNDGGFYVPWTGVLTIENDIEIVADADAPAKIQGNMGKSSGDGSTFTLNGNFSGDGCIEFGGTRSTTTFNGVNTAFAGTATVPDDSSKQMAGALRTKVTFKNPDATSSNAVWNIYTSDGRNFIGANNRTYYFGALSGNVYNDNASNWSWTMFEIGGANKDCEVTFHGVNHGSVNRHDKIRKVGTGVLALNDGTDHISEYTIVDGTLYVKGKNATPSSKVTFAGGVLRTRSYDTTSNYVDSATEETVVVNYTYKADWSALIKESTGPVAFDDDGVDYTWATEIAASNKGGLTKKGAGTLTLAVEPKYTGLTTVEAGMLVVPPGTELSYNALSDTNLVSGATITNYAYEANTALTAPAVSGSVVYDAPLDIDNIASIDASGITLENGQPYVIASATTVTGYTKASLADIPLTLPDGADAEKWVLKVLDVNGSRALCVAPKTSPFVILVR